MGSLVKILATISETQSENIAQESLQLMTILARNLISLFDAELLDLFTQATMKWIQKDAIAGTDAIQLWIVVINKLKVNNRNDHKG